MSDKEEVVALMPHEFWRGDHATIKWAGATLDVIAASVMPVWGPGGREHWIVVVTTPDGEQHMISATLLEKV